MKARARIVASAVIWGSMGLVVRPIALSSGAIALIRGLLGALFLFGLIALGRRRVDFGSIRKNAWLLILSGALLGANWIFLFEAYRHTTIALATLSYYLAPVILTAASPLVIRERLNARKVLCVFAALAGMALISGIGGLSAPGGNLSGILLGLCAAVCYASLTMVNKFVKGVAPLESTLIQLIVSSAALAPYLMATGGFDVSGIGLKDILLLIVLGVAHTGLAFWWYFASVRELPAQTVAALTYIDPATAILLSTLLLGEAMRVPQMVGAALILGAALTAELPSRRAAALPPKETC